MARKITFFSSLVIWIKSDSDWVKLNFDDYCKGNSESFGGNDIIREHYGNFFIAYADFYDYCNNNMIEAKTLPRGLKICLDEGYSSMIVQSDFQVTINMINNKMKIF
ncbi:hypothetical protein RDI58_014781 [Solanum bulbocastanum]|uniref:RNase H type-1 domain-containing protein n=1 Tax=Solanum bulbocastanum TaxID=147425 RepID=A0AAN8TIW3_SOLBU